jgi:hypothetical protein
MAKTDMKTLLARKDDVLTAIQNYTNEHNRPCPTDHLEEQFGDITKLLQILKMTEEVTGLRGRVGGLVLTDDVDALKESMAAAKKAAKKPKKAKVAKAPKAAKPKKSKAKVETVEPEDDEDVEIEDEDEDNDSADVAAVITDAEPVEDEDLDNLISDINDIVEDNAFSEA